MYRQRSIQKFLRSESFILTVDFRIFFVRAAFMGLVYLYKEFCEEEMIG
jgi:hypothetical protein